jgi:ABC-type multidrug transport system fused ATPase/permease subunit
VLAGRTLIVIAHRHATAQRCDVVAHVEHGQVVATTAPRA